MRYRLLIFDFDGTLADSLPMFLKHMHEAGEHFGLRSMDEQDLDRMRGLSAREIIKHFGIPYWKVPLMVRYMRRLMTADGANTRLFPGIPALLCRLKEKGIVLAIVTSTSEANIRAILGPENAQLVNVYQCGASIFGKAARFGRVLKQMGVQASQALAIGDEIRDLDSAREAEVAFGAVSWGYTRADALRACAPECMFETPQQIEGVVFADE